MCMMSAKESSTVLVYDKLNEKLAMDLFLLSNFLSFTTSPPTVNIIIVKNIFINVSTYTDQVDSLW